MRYEPIGYEYGYEIGALLVFLVILLRYFTARRFPNQRNSLYALILWATVADVVLDVLSSLIIDNVFRVPLAITHTVNTLFYAMSIVMLALMTLYAYARVGYISRQGLRRILPLLLPGLLVLLLLLNNPYSHWFFYVDPQLGYVHGSMFVLIYATCFVYLLFTLILVLRSRARLRREEYTTILLFLAVVCVSTVVQYFFPTFLVTGVAIMLAVVLMYFTIQNPESMVDLTTGAFTYEAMLTFLRDRLDEGQLVQLTAIKIHNMPRINELLGVENGSLLLRQLCLFLSESADDTWVFRMRGSCFVAITRRGGDYAALRRRLDPRVGLPWSVNGVEVLLQATVCGMETQKLLTGPISPQEAVKYLETAFSHKQEAGERITEVNVGPSLLAQVRRDSAVEAALREALVSGQGLELHFQPLWSTRMQRFTSAEVLLRFNHPQLGYVPPDEFVAIAENNGFITALDEFVVRQTCAFVREQDRLRELGIETLEINLSALEFMQRSLPQLLQDIMEQYQIDPGFLCFEVTETAATESFALLHECMYEILKFGCQFALDDFGTGYANISQVIRLPFSVVKLDKSMLNGPPVVLEDLVRMFARIDRRTVIEGIETADQDERVISLGVDMIQGFYYAKPMNGAALLKFLQK